MAETFFYIPLQHESGTYKLSELVQKEEDSLELFLGEYDILQYEIPSFERCARMYSIDEDELRDTMEVVYDEQEVLQRITYVSQGKSKLLYINLTNSSYTQKMISGYISENAKNIAEQLLVKKGKVYRLFFDYFYDGQAVDYAALLGFEADVQAIVDEYDGERDALDNSGDYPQENRIQADTDSLGVFLMCMDHEEAYGIFNEICEKMTEEIKKLVLESLEKAEDFEVIAGEYD